MHLIMSCFRFGLTEFGDTEGVSFNSVVMCGQGTSHKRYYDLWRRDEGVRSADAVTLTFAPRVCQCVCSLILRVRST